MTNESQFSRWFCKKLRDYGCFVQRIETSTGNGVPDLFVAKNSQDHEIQMHSYWLELKWNTLHIRPEQYVWSTKYPGYSAVIVGRPDGSILSGCAHDAKPGKKSYILDKKKLLTYENIEDFLKAYFY